MTFFSIFYEISKPSFLLSLSVIDKFIRAVGLFNKVKNKEKKERKLNQTMCGGYWNLLLLGFSYPISRHIFRVSMVSLKQTFLL